MGDEGAKPNLQKEAIGQVPPYGTDYNQDGWFDLVG